MAAVVASKVRKQRAAQNKELKEPDPSQEERIKRKLNKVMSNFIWSTLELLNFLSNILKI